MALLQELATAVRERRQDIGLSQDELAAMAGLSRATVNALEGGRLGNLASTRVEALANALGFAVGLLPARVPPAQAAEEAARLASVPYRTSLPPEALRDAVAHGTVPPGFIPHLRTLLQEAPVAMLAALAQEVQAEHGLPVATAWAHMRVIARVLRCDRPLWNAGRT